MRIAITGSIGSGKTTVCDYIQRQGYPVISADDVNSELLRQPEIRQHITELLELENFSREAVSLAIFKDNSKRLALTEYLHPQILKRFFEFFEDHPEGLVFAEVPLLFEAGWDRYFDFTVAVITDPSIADKRLMTDRHILPKEARRRRLKQIAQEEKVRRSDYTITNNGDLSQLKSLTDQLIILLLEKESEYTVKEASYERTTD